MESFNFDSLREKSAEKHAQELDEMIKQAGDSTEKYLDDSISMEDNK